MSCCVRSGGLHSCQLVLAEVMSSLADLEDLRCYTASDPGLGKHVLSELLLS